MKVTALAGGVGGAKLLVGLQRALPHGALSAIVNTADDDVIYGVHVSPDVDIVTYWLAGLADVERGWGLRDDTFTVVEALGRLGGERWFGLGDRDLATCLYRTERIRSGVALSVIADEIRKGLGVPSRVLPMSDDPVRTRVTCRDGTELSFQEYFVREQTKPQVASVTLDGIGEAKQAPGILEAIREADRVVLCPSNPVMSIGPILALPGVREALVTHPSVVAVSPLVRGRALKGPADRLMSDLGMDPSASTVAGLYRDFVKVFVVDATDGSEAARVATLGMRVTVLDTLMKDHDASERLARGLLAP